MSTIIMATNSNGKTRRCDSRCHDARGKKCVCICQGKNHGVGVAQAIDNTNLGFFENLGKEHPSLEIWFPRHNLNLFKAIQ